MSHKPGGGPPEAGPVQPAPARLAPLEAVDYRARCLLALSVLHHRTRTFDPTNSDVIALERVLQGLDLESIAYGEAH